MRVFQDKLAMKSSRSVSVGPEVQKVLLNEHSREQEQQLSPLHATSLIKQVPSINRVHGILSVRSED